MQHGLSKNQVDVADFYDSQRNVSFAERQQSRILHGRNFHNWIKSVLIDKAVQRLPGPPSVLDLCGGKGGDLLKWKSAGISHLLLADISLNSVQVRKFRPFSLLASNSCHSLESIICVSHELINSLRFPFRMLLKDLSIPRVAAQHRIPSRQSSLLRIVSNQDSCRKYVRMCDSI